MGGGRKRRGLTVVPGGGDLFLKPMMRAAPGLLKALSGKR